MVILGKGYFMSRLKQMRCSAPLESRGHSDVDLELSSILATETSLETIQQRCRAKWSIVFRGGGSILY